MVLSTLPYLSVPKLLEAVPDPNRSICLELWTLLTTEMWSAKWSNYNHQAREGGYFHHITEAMNIAKVEYELWQSIRPATYTLWDAQIVIFLHDKEKPFSNTEHSFDKYKWLQGYELRNQVIKDWWFNLTDEHRNALKYIHGEWSDYTNTKRVSTSLAAFCHIVDTKSARERHNYGKEGKW